MQHDSASKAAAHSADTYQSMIHNTGRNLSTGYARQFADLRIPMGVSLAWGLRSRAMFGTRTFRLSMLAMAGRRRFQASAFRLLPGPMLGPAVRRVHKHWLLPVIGPPTNKALLSSRNMTTDSPENVWGFTVKDAEAADVPLSTYQNKKVLLIVNVASQCGFTPQYKDLQALQDEFGDKGFSVLAFPCNQFGGQEPGSAEEVCQWSKDRFKTTFPILDKVDVNGKDAHPLFEYLKSKQTGFITNAVKWNFTKFLVVDGVPTKRYGPQESPLSFKADIEAALAS